MKDGIIAEIQCQTINGEPTELIKLHNGLMIALSSNTLACYKNQQSITDPLGNGLLSYVTVPADHLIQFENGHCIAQYRSGYVGLIDNKALLIAPFHIRLFPNNQDGLRGLNCLAELELPEIDVY